MTRPYSRCPYIDINSLSQRTNPRCGASGVWSLSGIGLLFRRSAQQIVDTGVIVICQLVQDIDRNVQSAQFVIGICGLMDLKMVRQSGLLQVMVLPKVPQSVSVHSITHKLLCFKGYSLIDI